MKAIDDEWQYISGGWPYDIVRRGTSQKIADVWGDGVDDAHATADLIAAAPDMLRLLVKIRQTYVPGDAEAREIEAVLRKASALDALPDWCSVKAPPP